MPVCFTPAGVYVISETTLDFTYRIVVIYTALAIEYTFRSQVFCKDLLSSHTLSFIVYLELE